MMCRSAEARDFMLPSLMGWMAYYALVGYGPGARYQIVNAQRVGAPRQLVIDAFAVAQLFAAPEQLSSTLSLDVADELDVYTDPEPRQLFPEGWVHNSAAFSSGLDFSSTHLSGSKSDSLRHWYEAILGEVPGYVDRMLVSCPDLLKSYRRRFETALQVAPKQVMPYMMIHLNLLFGRRESVREAFLLGRGFGMTREQLMDGIGRMVSYGGMTAVSMAAEVAGDVFQSYG